MKAGPTWIVVADGARARLFEQLRPGAALVERESFARRAGPVAQSRDRLARAYDRTGPARHAIEPREKLPRKLRFETGAVLKDIVDRPQAEIIALLQAELALSRD